MKQIVIETFGKIKDQSTHDLCQKYLDLCNHYIKTEIKIHKDPIDRKISFVDLDFSNTIILSERGKLVDSKSFANLIKAQISVNQYTRFVIGNAYGIDEAVLRSATTISLSPLTFTHELCLFILLEQIYRGLNINSGGKYHK